MKLVVPAGSELPIPGERRDSFSVLLLQSCHLKRYCKSFAIGRTNTKDAVEWHRLVTCVQHRTRNESFGIKKITRPGGQPGGSLRHGVDDAPVIPESLDARDVVSILRDSPVH